MAGGGCHHLIAYRDKIGIWSVNRLVVIVDSQSFDTSEYETDSQRPIKASEEVK